MRSIIRRLIRSQIDNAKKLRIEKENEHDVEQKEDSKDEVDNTDLRNPAHRAVNSN